MRKTILIAMVVLVAAVALVAAAPGFEKLARLTVWNRTGSTIYVLLTTPKDDGSMHYYLTVKPGQTVFTVERKVYNVTYWSCGAKMSGIADVLTQLSLTFTDCAYLHRWTFTQKYAQSVDAAPFDGAAYPVWYVNGSLDLYYEYGQDAAGNPMLKNAAGVVVPFAATFTPKYPMLYTQSTVPQNVMNFGEPSMEKVHNTLRRWEWISDSVRCDTGPAMASDGSVWDVWGWCTVGRHWGQRSYRSPFWQGNYYDSYRLSYNTSSARSIHWQVRGVKAQYAHVY